MIASPTLKFHRPIVYSRIVLQEYEGILPSAQISAQNKSGSVQWRFELLVSISNFPLSRSPMISYQKHGHDALQRCTRL